MYKANKSAIDNAVRYKYVELVLAFLYIIKKVRTEPTVADPGFGQGGGPALVRPILST